MLDSDPLPQKKATFARWRSPFACLFDFQPAVYGQRIDSRFFFSLSTLRTCQAVTQPPRNAVQTVNTIAPAIRKPRNSIAATYLTAMHLLFFVFLLDAAIIPDRHTGSENANPRGNDDSYIQFIPPRFASMPPINAHFNQRSKAA